MTAAVRRARPALRRPAAAARLTVDPAAVAANTRHLAGRTEAAVMAVVKADGFGHGAVTVARVALANGATWLGVTSLAEAVDLRTAGLRAPVLSWLNPVDTPWQTAVAADVDVAIGSLDHLEALLRTRGTTGARVHLHLDTGMARDGAEPEVWAQLCRLARRAEESRRISVVGVMGHLPLADDACRASNVAGLRRFSWGVRTARATGLRPRHRHLAATSALLADPRAHHSLVRIGAGLVGIDPTLNPTTALAPAMTLTAPVVAVRRVRGGTGVGYGHQWTAPRASTLALLPLGYADGLPRASSGRAEVSLRGRRFPVVGRISMDQAVIDLGDEHAEPGDEVTVFGPGTGGEPTVAAWAAWADTLPHEIVTGIGHRVERTVAHPGPRSLA